MTDVITSKTEKLRAATFVAFSSDSAIGIPHSNFKDDDIAIILRTAEYTDRIPNSSGEYNLETIGENTTPSNCVKVVPPATIATFLVNVPLKIL